MKRTAWPEIVIGLGLWFAGGLGLLVAACQLFSNGHLFGAWYHG
jgi:hypothetical protein